MQTLLTPGSRPTVRPQVPAPQPTGTPLPTRRTALAALASALLLASAPPQALAAGKVKIRNPKVKVEKESRATLLARAKTERLADLKAKVEMSKGGAKVALGF